MRTKTNLTNYFFISILLHFIFLGGLSYFSEMAVRIPQTNAYEIVTVTKQSGKLKNSLDQPKSKKLFVSDENLRADDSANDNQTPALTETENAFPTVQSDTLLSEGVRITNINEVTRSVKRTTEAIAHQIEGKIKLKLLIDEKGRLRQMTPLNTLGFGLDEVASQAAHRLIFIPARTKNGPVAVEIYYTVKFIVNHQ